MQQSPLNANLVTARIAIIMVGIALLILNINPLPLSTVEIVYVVLFTAAIFVADLMIVEIPQEGSVSASVAIILTAIFIGPEKLPTSIILVASILGTFADGIIGKKPFPVVSIITAKRLAAICTAAAALALWLRYAGQPSGFWFSLTGSVVAASAYFITETFIEALMFSLEKNVSFRTSLSSRTRLMAFVYFTFAIVSLLMSIMFKWMDFWSILIFSLPLAVTGQSFRLYLDIRKTYSSTIKALSAAIEAQDLKRVGHAQRVADYSLAIGRELGFFGSDLERLNYASMLHDIGKLGFDKQHKDLIVDRELTDRKNVPFHAQIGSEILSNVDYLKDVSSIIKFHHYRFSDKDTDQPFESRIIHLADSYDLLTTESRLSAGDALRKLQADKGFVYDPKVLRAFTAILRRQRKNKLSQQLTKN